MRAPTFPLHLIDEHHPGASADWPDGVSRRAFLHLLGAGALAAAQAACAQPTGDIVPYEDLPREQVPGVPPAALCLNCHNQIWNSSPMLQLVWRSDRARRPIRWQRVNFLPDFVYFNHAIHVQKGIGCETCHGRVDRMPRVFQAAPLTMGWCLDCHRDPAPHLRPQADIFSTQWRPPKDAEKAGRALMAAYHINTKHLTDCTVCHR